MKKIITSTMIIIIVICLCFTSTGCMDFLFSALGLGSDESENNKIVLQIHVNEETLSVNAYEDEQVTIEKLAIKQGYYLTGYFDAPEGGTKYFDSNGNSLSVWSKNNPTEFYAQWANVDNYMIKDSVTWDNTYSFSSSKLLGFYTINSATISAIDGNLSRTIRFTLSFKASCPAYTAGWGDDPNKQSVRYLKIVDTDDSSAESFYTQKFIINGLEYNDYSFDIDISARAFSKTTKEFKDARIVYFKFYAPDSIIRYSTYLKDVQITSMYILPENE